VPEEDSSGVDIFHLLEVASEAKQRKNRQRILESLDVKDFFEEGEISIDKQTCRGVECKLCIDVCPTHALYWKSGVVGVEETLCVYCTACVLSCIVDDCIRVMRKRPSGAVEAFSSPRQIFILFKTNSSQKKIDRTKSVPGWMQATSFPLWARFLSPLEVLQRLRSSS
jgi:Fe-S-cluster-containing hydrogenase component 2